MLYIAYSFAGFREGADMIIGYSPIRKFAFLGRINLQGDFL